MPKGLIVRSITRKSIVSGVSISVKRNGKGRYEYRIIYRNKQGRVKMAQRSGENNWIDSNIDYAGPWEAFLEGCKHIIKLNYKDDPKFKKDVSGRTVVKYVE